MAIKMTRAEYEQKYGIKPVLPHEAPAQVQEPSLGQKIGNFGKELIKTPLKIATSAINLGEAIGGAKEGEFSDPFGTGRLGASFDISKPMLAPENRKAVGESALAGLEIGTSIPLGRGVVTGGKALARGTAEVAGNVAGKSKGVVSQVVQKGKQAVKTMTPEEKALRAITPNPKYIKPEEYKTLVGQGRITPRKGLESAKYILDDTEKNVAKKFGHLLQESDPVKNIQNIKGEIAKQDLEVGQFLKQNNSIFNKGTLKNHLTKAIEDVSDIMAPSGNVPKAKKAIVDNFVNSIKTHNMEGLWKARKEFDRMIKSAFSGNPTLQKEMKTKLRNAVQDYIAEHTPEGVYKNKMKDMSSLFDAEDLLGDQAARERALNAVQVWMKNNPGKVKAAQRVIGTGAVGVGLNAIVN